MNNSTGRVQASPQRFQYQSFAGFSYRNPKLCVELQDISTNFAVFKILGLYQTFSKA